MKNIKRIIIGSIVIACCASSMVFAKAGSYDSYYEMYGGVFSRWIKPKSKVTISITPSVGTSDCNMGVIWAEHRWYGWDGDEKFTSSVYPSTVSFKSKEKRKVWLRDYAGQYWAGDVTFAWD